MSHSNASTTPCPLCGKQETGSFSKDKGREYFRCPDCFLIFTHPRHHLPPADEKKRYDLHQNSPQDAEYRNFLNRLFLPLNALLKPASRGLDFGSGPGPTLSVMLEEAGHKVSLYDSFYAPDPRVFEHRYDFITATEVLEHLREPRQELDRLWHCLKRDGVMGVMTKLARPDRPCLPDQAAARGLSEQACAQEVFAKWHYKNDDTHICFYSKETFHWLGKKWGADVTFEDADVILLKKKIAVSDEDFKTSLRVLEALIENPVSLEILGKEDRIRFMKAAGRLSRPTVDERRKLARTARRMRRERRKIYDRELRENTGIRKTRQKPVFHEPKKIEQAQELKADFTASRHCYICKKHFSRVHFFYDTLCGDCGDFNYHKRYQTADLAGRTALVTGGRVKIGYYTALKLLRAGAKTIVSTRFPHDAALRFSKEEDFGDWKGRLQIHGLDLRHSPSVEMFARYLLAAEDRLDFLINNAAQTVRKPPGFYRHLMEWETKAFHELPQELRPLLESHENCKHALDTKLLPLNEGFLENNVIRNWPGTIAPAGPAAPYPSWPTRNPAVGLRASAQLSMIPYNFDEEDLPDPEIFPAGKLDQDLQQVDLRSMNSWRLALADVSTPEMLEVHLVNAVAPFILASKLKALMLKHPTDDKQIVNASAMEGKFARHTKTDKHPHTNMAKAALNMLTLTSAADYAKSGIFMNAVDTGWITDEDPAQLSRAKKEMHDFEPPLDIVDGAARLLDPVFDGILTGKQVWGKFLKDYKPTEW